MPGNPGIRLDGAFFRAYGLDMDKPYAMKILELGPGATAPEAKIAFRRLAKSCHPDRFARQPERAAAAEAKMKEINAAFKFLLPLLPQTAPLAETDKRFRRADAAGFFSSVARVARRFRKRSGTTPKNTPPVGKPSSVNVSSPGKKSRRPGPSPGKHPKKRPPRFDTVLNRTAPGRGNTYRPGRLVSGPGIYDNYYRYMAVNRQIRNRRNRSEKTGIGRVTAIRPVRPVSRIGEE